MKVLAFADYYLPGFRAGGPIRTISGMVRRLPERIQFSIVTRDRDCGDHRAYAGVKVGEWNDVGRARVLYLRNRDLNLAGLVRLVRVEKPDVLYANSLFSRITLRLLAARRIGCLGSVPLVLAPRGEFSAGALKLKPRRKAAYLALGRRAGLFRTVLWQASSEVEGSDILRILGGGHEVRVSRDISDVSDVFEAEERTNHAKRSGAVRFVFLSRVSPMKNLRAAIEVVSGISGNVSLDIFGPADEPRYLQECKAATEKVQSNVKVTWHGEVAPPDVTKTIAGFDFFILPTLGENFGHVILESLSAGCPVLISDRTLWNRIEADGAGWTIPLEDQRRWNEVLRQCVEMGESEHNSMRERARLAARECLCDQAVIQQNVALFDEAVARRQ